MSPEQSLFSLKGKVIVITGASGLLGRKHAEAVAAFDGIPVLLDLSQDLLEEQAAMLRQRYSVNAAGFSVNITDETQVKNNAALLIKKFGKIDGLVNNAANNPKVEDNLEKKFSRLENFQLDMWNQDIEVGLTGAFLCVKHYGHEIAQNPLGGVIVNISSDLGLIAPDQRLYSNPDLKTQNQSVKPITYSVVKTGLLGLTRYIATYWTDKNVRCNAICPGGVENGQSETFINNVSSRIPMGRLAKHDEYQGTLIWMLSDASSYLNGAIVAVDGGRSSW
jgi:NAD(P)-dependent dehydrogenase (short-subunit alcohol dehydrogenase family)